jgi:nucleotide-binding universal stress UspA family protein
MASAMREQLHVTRVELRRAACEVAEHCVTQAEEKGLKARPQVAVGIPWQEICRHARSERYDMVVAGTRDPARHRLDLFGSTCMGLLRDCPSPVWMIPPRSRSDRFNILVPTDFSVSALDAARIAVDLGRFEHACVHLLHVLDGSAGLPTWYSRVSSQMVERYVARRVAEAEEKLLRQLSELGDVPAETEVRMHIVRGFRDEEILRAIDDLHANLLVVGMAARFKSGLACLGETTANVIAHMKCSLLAVKSPAWQDSNSEDSDEIGQPIVPSVLIADHC